MRGRRGATSTIWLLLFALLVFQPAAVSAKAGFKTISGAKYYVYEDGGRAVGMTKIGKYKYYFDGRGKLVTNRTAVKLNGVYYNIDKKGRLSKASAAQLTSSKEAKKFIKKHTSARQSKAQKFKACFRYLQGHMRYVPNRFPMNKDYQILSKKDGVYQMANQMFKDRYLWGNCHRFACCVAAVAKELGYKPYVVVTQGDHSFCMIGGKYYDNMYGGLFGTSKRPGTYTVYKKVLF